MKRTIKLSNAVQFLRKASKQGYNMLGITGGGEPFLVKDTLFKVLEKAKKYGFSYISVNTNSSYITLPDSEKIIKKLKAIGVNRFHLSIDHDHLQFIPYEKIIESIKCVLRNNITVTIKTVSRKDTYLKNLKLIKKISKDLNGRLIKIPFPKTLCKDFFVIFSPDWIIVNLNFNVCGNASMRNKNILKEIKECKLERLIFNYCGLGNRAYINEESYVLPCCSFHCLNNPKLYGFKLSKNKCIDSFDSLMNQIIKDKLVFVKIYLRIQKNKKLMKTFEKKHFYTQCDLCFFILKNRKKIEKIIPPSKFELIQFIAPRFHHFLEYYVSDSISNFICTSKLLKIIGRILIIRKKV
jgi:hypothetical protein